MRRYWEDILWSMKKPSSFTVTKSFEKSIHFLQVCFLFLLDYRIRLFFLQWPNKNHDVKSKKGHFSKSKEFKFRNQKWKLNWPLRKIHERVFDITLLIYRKISGSFASLSWNWTGGRRRWSWTFAKGDPIRHNALWWQKRG